MLVHQEDEEGVESLRFAADIKKKSPVDLTFVAIAASSDPMQVGLITRIS